MVFFSVSNYGVILGNVNFQGMYFQGVHLEILENHRLMESADLRGWSSFDSCNLFKTAGFPKLKVPPRNLTQIYQQLPIFERKSPFPNHHFWLVFGPLPKKKRHQEQHRNALKWGTTLPPRKSKASTMIIHSFGPHIPGDSSFFFMRKSKSEVLCLKTVREIGGWQWGWPSLDLKGLNWENTSSSFFLDTQVDGRNPKQPPGTYKNHAITGYYPYQLVQDFFHQQSHVVFDFC